jgi:putative ABC transport system ATP-binding protein
MPIDPNYRNNAIYLDNVCFSKEVAGRPPTNILKDITLSARSSKITAIIGPSGSGKSSLIRLINRLCDPTSGSIFFSGKDISQINPVLLRRQIAMVLQKPFMFEGTVLSNLQRPFMYSSSDLPDSDEKEILTAMELARLSPALLERDARTLSLGEQQRVNIARALITKPQVLLLDEPTSALDRPTADGLAATLKEICLKRELVVILVTHDLRLAERVADYLYFLVSGVIKEEGLPSEILKRPACPELINFLEDPQTLES